MSILQLGGATASGQGSVGQLQAQVPFGLQQQQQQQQRQLMMQQQYALQHQQQQQQQQLLMQQQVYCLLARLILNMMRS